MTESVAYKALERANEAKAEIKAHEDLCAVRYDAINKSIGKIESWLKWGGTTAFSMVIALLGFLALQVYHANNTEVRGQAARIEVLQSQLSDARASAAATAPPR